MRRLKIGLVARAILVAAAGWSSIACTEAPRSNVGADTMAPAGSASAVSVSPDSAEARRDSMEEAPPPPPPPPPPPEALPQKVDKTPDLAQDIGVPPHTPGEGTSERAAIVDAIRRAVGNTTRYRVNYVRATPRWAYFEGTEIVQLEGNEVQETDLTAQALLEHRNAGDQTWDVVELWTLPTDDKSPRAEFLAALRQHIVRDAVPKALFPKDLFK